MIRRVGAILLMLSLSASADQKLLPYVLMQDDLAELKQEFNNAVDQVRLVFIVGPT